MDYRSMIPAGLGMALFIGGTYAVPGSLIQRLVFLLGAAILLGTALYTRQLLLVVLEVVVTLSALLAFTPTSVVVRLSVFGAAALVGIGYLVAVRYHETDPYYPLGAAGLLILSAGLPISEAFPLYFDGLMTSGAALLALYSFIVYAAKNIPVQLAWGIFNVIFTIRPLVRLAKRFGLTIV